MLHHHSVFMNTFALHWGAAVCRCNSGSSVPCCISGVLLHSRSCTPLPCECEHGHAAWPFRVKGRWNDRNKRWEDKRVQQEKEMKRDKTKCKVECRNRCTEVMGGYKGGERETESKSSWRENITKSQSGKNKLKTKHCSSKASACMCVFTFSTSTLVAETSHSAFSACCEAFSASAHSLA